MKLLLLFFIVMNSYLLQSMQEKQQTTAFCHGRLISNDQGVYYFGLIEGKKVGAFKLPNNYFSAQKMHVSTQSFNGYTIVEKFKAKEWWDLLHKAYEEDMKKKDSTKPIN